MRLETVCQLIRDLQAVRMKTHRQQQPVNAALNRLWKWVERMRPPRKHQAFDIYRMRYVDEGE